jgi:hypothetical protein
MQTFLIVDSGSLMWWITTVENVKYNSGRHQNLMLNPQVSVVSGVHMAFSGEARGVHVGLTWGQLEEGPVTLRAVNRLWDLHTCMYLWEWPTWCEPYQCQNTNSRDSIGCQRLGQQLLQSKDVPPTELHE